jgi:hypothetical protein
MATLSFVNAYAVNTATTPARKEANDLDIVFTSLNGALIDDGGGATFSGNDVAVELEIDGVTYFGWISRPIKDGQLVNGFYFWSDPAFTSLAAAAANNSDPDNDDSNNFGFVLVVDQAAFNADLDLVPGSPTLRNVNTSSDGVADNLNDVLPEAPPGAPTVVITEDADNDGVISGSELIGAVNVTVTLPGDAEVGDELTVSDGFTDQTFILDAGDISAGAVLTTFAAPAEGGTITVEAFLTDPDNQQGSSGIDSAVRDTTGPSPITVEIIEDANNDGVISVAELSGNVNVLVTLPVSAVAGDVLHVTDGINPQSIILTGAHITAGEVGVSFAPPAVGGTITVTAFVTDQFDNNGSSDQDAAVRAAAAVSAPVVVITEDANNNGIISASELNGNVNVVVTLPAGAVAGDELTVTDGTTTHTFILTGAQITGGTVSDSFTPPPEGGTITVTAFVTNQLNVQGPSGSDSAVRDTTAATAPTVVITEDANNNAILTDAELIGDVDVSVSLPAGAVAGDELTVTDGITTKTFVLTGAQVTAGVVTTTFAPPPVGGTITVTAFVTDQSNNQGSSGQDSATRVSVSPVAAPVVVITEDANNNAVITAAELSGNVDVSVTLPAGAVAGDVLTVTDGLTVQTFTLTTLQITAGSVSTAFTPPPEGGTITVTAQVNGGPTGSDFAVRDTVGPSPLTVVIIEDSNNDAVITPNELSGNVDVSITLPAAAVAGDVLTATDGVSVQSAVLTALHIAAGAVTTSFAPPAAGGTITVTAFVTDQFGNQGASASDAAVLTTNTPVYSVLLANGDRFYSTDAGEAAVMAQGTGNVLEGARFDSLTVGGQQMFAHQQPFTTDWYFAAAGGAMPYACYQLVPEMDGFMAAAPGSGVGQTYHLYLSSAGITQLVTQAEAAQLGLAAQGYVDGGAQFSTTNVSSFTFDAEGYLVANKTNAGIQAFVQALAAQFSSTSQSGFIEAVEQDFLARVDLTGIPHGGAATAADLNAAFGTAFTG